MTTYENSLDSKKNHCPLAAEDHLENGVVATIICLAVGLLVFVQGGGPTGDPKKFAMGWFMMGMAATFGLATALRWWQGKPVLVYSKRGLRRAGLLTSRFWPWHEIGPLHIHTEVFDREGEIRSFYLCAFTDLHHDLLVNRKDLKTPTKKNADICIRLDHSAVGTDQDEAERFAAHLNEWRQRFGRPEIKVDEKNAHQRYEKLIRLLNVRYVRSILLGLAASLPPYVYWHFAEDIGFWLQGLLQG